MGADLATRRVQGGSGTLIPTVPSPPLIVRVLPDVSGLDRVFDYVVPEHVVGRVGVGTRVRVVLQGRRVAGWVVAWGSTEPDVHDIPVDRLLPLTDVIGEGPRPEVVELTQWAAHLWCGPRRAALVAASPINVVRHLAEPRHFTPDSSWSAMAHPLVTNLLTRGGGLLRWPPTWDVLPVIASAQARGPVLVVTASVRHAELLGRRAERHGVSVAVLPRGWAAAAGGVDVVIGARHAVWGPCPELSSIIVIDEHDEAHFEERAPTWHGPDVAAERAKRAGVPLLMVSPCPTVVAHHRHGPPVAPSKAEERESWPLVDLVDVGDRPPWDRSPLTSPARQWLADTTRRVVCISNTTGQARLLACRGCSQIVRCSACDAAVGQQDDLALVCRRCGSRRPPVCAACGSSALTVLKPGLARLRKEIQAAARRPVVEITGTRVDEETDLWSTAGVVMGTEAALHRVRRADVVVFCDLDAELLAPRYRAEEAVVGLLARAARLVGPRRAGGRVVVQTALPEHRVLRAVQSVELERLIEPELARRAELGWPPSGAVATIQGEGAELWTAALRSLPDQPVEVLGPSEGRYLIRSSSAESLAQALSDAPRPARSRCRVVVDPPRL